MPSELRVKTGTALTWRDVGGDYGLTLSGLANSAARQGAKGDLGATRAETFDVEVVMETGTAPASGNVINVYWAPSVDAVAGNQNPGACSGVDAGYTGSAGDSIANTVRQLDYVGSLVLTNDLNTIQRTHLVYSPPSRYGMPIVENLSGQALRATTNHLVRLTPIMPEAQ